MPINTRRVQGRRRLDFLSYEEMLADAEHLTCTPVKVLGNWSVGQIFQHLALTCNCAIDGFPMTFPWYFRLMAKLAKGMLLRGTMPAGFQLKGAAVALMPEPVSTGDGLISLKNAVTRMEKEPRKVKHPFLGNLTEIEWKQLTLKHASLHLSFIVPLEAT